MVDAHLCEEAKGYKALIFYVALYLVALGSGCLKPNIISHGADQLRLVNKDSNKLSSYFNAAYFSFCTGQLIALTLIVWLQTRYGMDVGFGVSAAAMLVALISLISATFLYSNKPPRGSIFTPFAQFSIFIFFLPFPFALILYILFTTPGPSYLYSFAFEYITLSM